MKALQKKILIAFLCFSNLAVLGLVFHAHFDSHQNLFLFSTAENMADLRKKVKRECKQSLEELVKGKRSSFICNVRVKRDSYTLRTKVTVTKKKNGGFVLTGQGAMREKKKHATEAQFCNDCSFENTVEQNGKLTEVMGQVIDMAEKFYEDAQESVKKAQKKYNKKNRAKRIAKIKEQRCEGRWNETDEQFEEFELEDRLKCKKNRISELDLPLEIEDFYHRDIKKELWRTALSDDYYLLEDLDLLDMFNKDPYRYPFSVRASANLLGRYINHWRDDFDSLGSLPSQINFVRNIKSEVNQMTNLMKKEQSQIDLYYLNKSFDGLLAKVKQIDHRMPRLPSSPTQSPPIILER